MDKLSFLKRYRKSIEFVSKEDLLNIEKKHISEKWMEVLIETNKAERKNKLIALWNSLPNKSLHNLKMQQVWSSVPKSINKFYEELHNGFYYFPSQAMGVIRLEQITHFSEYEWGILEELDEPLGLNIDTTYGFFENGMGGYVAVDLNNCKDNLATL